MSFFRKLFGQNTPLDSLRRAHQQQRWSDVLSFAEEVDLSSLDAQQQSETASFVAEAGDRLAELNLLEGEACLRGGEIARSAEHFALALEQARTPAVRQKVADMQKELGQAPVLPAAAAVAKEVHGHAGCGGGCGSGGAHGCGSESTEAEAAELDDDTHLELLLGSYPADWQRQAELAGAVFRQALLAAHQGETDGVLTLFDQVPAEDRNELYFFERGCLRLRLGKVDGGCADFSHCLTINPDNLIVFDNLIGCELSAGRFAGAEKRLQDQIAQGRFLPYCNGRLALLLYRRGEINGALEHGLRALELGSRDTDATVVTAMLLERAGRLAEAEQALNLIKGGGCSGGANIHLAEFWLRHRKNLEKALEAFKGAAREESANPRWALRIGQTYLSMGWKKEGKSLLEKSLKDDRLDPALRKEALDLLAASN